MQLDDYTISELKKDQVEAFLDHMERQVKENGQTGTPIFTAIGRRVEEKRKMLGLSQMQAADLIGIPQGTLSRVERGVSQPTKTNRAKLDDWLAGALA